MYMYMCMHVYAYVLKHLQGIIFRAVGIKSLKSGAAHKATYTPNHAHFNFLSTVMIDRLITSSRSTPAADSTVNSVKQAV